MSTHVVSVLICTCMATISSTLNTGDDIYTQDYWESKLAISIPSLRVMKRQLRHFKSGYDASVTLIYQSSQPVDVRWYILDTRLPNSEVPNMRPLDGDENYDVTYMSSGYVTAVTLTMPRFRESFPLDFETVLTTSDGSKQFQLRTVVRQRLELELNDINSPEWLLIPQPSPRLAISLPLSLYCAVFIPREMSGFTNELTMYHTAAPVKRDQVDLFEVVARMHNDTPDVTERQERGRLVVARRYITSAGHSVYRVGFTTDNATSDLNGVYQCSVERQNDRLFAITPVTLSSSSSTISIPNSSARPATSKLNVDLVSCERNTYDSKKGILTMKEGLSTCLRCKATGGAKLTVALYRGGSNTSETEVIARKGSGVGVRKYVNVADGGVLEAAYTFNRPRASTLRGQYACVASSSGEADNNNITKRLAFYIAFNDVK